MSDLISFDRAKAQLPNAPDSDDPVVAALVSACSSVVEGYCRRSFAQATYDELQHGTGTPYLYVNNPPIQRVVSVRTGLMPGLYVQFNDTTNQTQLATVDVTSTAVVLTKTYSGTTTTNSFGFASYPLMTDLGTAINALGNGWVATVPQQFALWQTSDLNHQLGSYGARNMSVPLNVYWMALPFFKVNEGMGEIYNGGRFTPGYQNYRVTYVGGYGEIPEEVQQAVAELVQLTYASITSNPNMQSETLDKYSYTKAATNSFDNLSLTAKTALNQHKVYRVARYK